MNLFVIHPYPDEKTHRLRYSAVEIPTAGDNLYRFEVEATQSVSQMANRIINDKNAPTGHEARRKWLGIDSATYQKVRAEVNRRL